MANLAVEFAARKIDVTLLTAQWQPDWPREITYRGLHVVRLRQPALRGWGTFCYMRALARWLRDHEVRRQLVYVSMLKHDAYAALGAVGRRVPVVLRAEGAGPTGDCHWQLDANFGGRIKRRAMKADALIGPSRAIERELIAAGYPRTRIHYVPNGVPLAEPVDRTAKQKARKTLAAVRPDLNCPADCPLAVYTGRLHEGKGLDDLVTAWQRVVARRPGAQLWLAGEGPHERALHERIGAANLAGHVSLPGVFDNVDDLLAAADLFVLPSLQEGLSVSLLEAMAAGLPVVATDIPGNRDLVTDGDHGLLVPVRDSEALSVAILRLLDDPPLGARLGRAARERVEEEFSVKKVVDRHLELFERLIESKEKKA
jgi:glycosyltransferase involved in cell wall biosynthesis